MQDSLGLAITCASPQALAAYEQALQAHLYAWPGTLAALDEALAHDPGFALAHALRALPLATWGRMTQAREAAANARNAATAGCTEREQAQIALICALVEGRAPEALQRVLDHARHWSADAVALGTALGAFGLLAFSGRLDHDRARFELVESLAPHYPADHAWLLAHRAWVRIECGAVDEGMDFARRSLAARPANGNIAHILMHGHFEADAPQAALDFLDGWIGGYPQEAILWGHLHWHAALAHLALGDAGAALARLLGPMVDYEVHGAPLMRLTDHVSLCWRLGLDAMNGSTATLVAGAGSAAASGAGGRRPGMPLPASAWARAASIAEQHYAQGGNPFAELHLAMLAAQRRDAAALHACASRLQRGADAGHAGAALAQHWVRGLSLLVQGDPDSAQAALDTCCAELPRLGGSHAQRTVVELTRDARALAIA